MQGGLSHAPLAPLRAPSVHPRVWGDVISRESPRAGSSVPSGLQEQGRTQPIHCPAKQAWGLRKTSCGGLLTPEPFRAWQLRPVGRGVRPPQHGLLPGPGFLSSPTRAGWSEQRARASGDPGSPPVPATPPRVTGVTPVPRGGVEAPDDLDEPVKACMSVPPPSPSPGPGSQQVSLCLLG